MIQFLAGAGRGMRHWIHVAGLNGTSQSFVFCRNCVEIFKASSSLNWPQLMDSQDLLPSPSWHLMVRQKWSDISATLCRCHVNNLKLKPSGKIKTCTMHLIPTKNTSDDWGAQAKGQIWGHDMKLGYLQVLGRAERSNFHETSTEVSCSWWFQPIRRNMKPPPDKGVSKKLGATKF